MIQRIVSFSLFRFAVSPSYSIQRNLVRGIPIAKAAYTSVHDLEMRTLPLLLGQRKRCAYNADELYVRIM